MTKAVTRVNEDQIMQMVDGLHTDPFPSDKYQALESAISAILAERDEAVAERDAAFLKAHEWEDSNIRLAGFVSKHTDELTADRDKWRLRAEEAAERARISDGTTQTVIQGTQDLSDEISKLIAERDLANTCVVCSASLLPREEIPHCENCIVTEQHEADYRDRIPN